MPVVLANNLLPLTDLNPLARNTNGATSNPNYSSTTVAPIYFDGFVNRLYLEGVSGVNHGGSDNETGPLLATSLTRSPQGPYVIKPYSFLINPLTSSSWENYEVSVSSLDWDASNNRLIAWYHGGNNSGSTANGGRQIGMMYSTDGNVGQAFSRDAGNPVLTAGSSGATDDKGVSDLKVLRLASGSYLYLYCGRQVGGPSDGTIHRATAAFSSPSTITKHGQVIGAGGAGSWNQQGLYPGMMWQDPGGRIHLFAGAASTNYGGFNGAVGYFYSDDDGATWTAYSSNPVYQPSSTSAWDGGDTGQVIGGRVDGDIAFIIFGGLNLSYADNSPERGCGAAITPARVATPSKTGKFYMPAGAAWSFTSVSGNSIHNYTAFSVFGRFRAIQLNRSAPQYRTVFSDSVAFNIDHYLRIESNGQFGAWYRNPTNYTGNMYSGITVDDGLWHEFLFVRKSTAYFELWVKIEGRWILCATSSVDCGTDSTATNKAVGNYDSANSGYVTSAPMLGTVSDLVVITGNAITPSQATSIIRNRSQLTTLGLTATIDFPSAGSDTGDVPVVEANGGGPVIDTQPTGQTVASGSTATFSLSAYSFAGTPTYQWRKNGTSISGATSSSYTTGTLSSANNGEIYDCIVTDTYASIYSQAVRLSITGISDAGDGRSLPTAWAFSRAQLTPDTLGILRKKIDAGVGGQVGYTAWTTWFWGLNVSNITVADTGSGSDAVGALTNTFTIAETGSGADSPVISVSFTVADSGAGADAASITASFQLADTGAGSDGMALSILIHGDDSGAGADALASIAATLGALAETGTGSDAPAISVTFGPLADSGAGSDSSVVQVLIAAADTASASDSIGSIIATLSGLGDTGASVDAVASIVAALLLAETGAGTDGITVSQGGNLVTVSDAGTGADAVLGIGVTLSPADAGSGTDAVAAIGVAFQLADVAAGADTLALQVTIAQNDAGSGADAAAVTTVYVSLADGGAGVEQAIISAGLTLIESAFGADAVNVSTLGALREAAHMVRVAVVSGRVRAAAVQRLQRFKVLN